MGGIEKMCADQQRDHRAAEEASPSLFQAETQKFVTKTNEGSARRDPSRKSLFAHDKNRKRRPKSCRAFRSRRVSLHAARSFTFFLAHDLFWLAGDAGCRATDTTVGAAHAGAAAIRPFETFGMRRAISEHGYVGRHFRRRTLVLERHRRSLLGRESRCGKK